MLIDMLGGTFGLPFFISPQAHGGVVAF